MWNKTRPTPKVWYFEDRVAKENLQLWGWVLVTKLAQQCNST